MRYVRQMNLQPGMSLSRIASEMKSTGVLGAGRFGLGVHVLAEMFCSPDYTNFLAIAGPVVASGLRNLISELIRLRKVHALVTTGANIVHDILESLGHHHLQGSFAADDRRLEKQGLARIGDIYVRLTSFRDLEKFLYRCLDKLPEAERQRISISRILRHVGEQVKDRKSILWNAAQTGVPVFSPGFLDSMAGLSVWTYSQLKKLRLDPLDDLSGLVNMTFDSKRVGMIVLGGGLPKHHTQLANLLRGGVDAAVQITMDRPEPGGLSGASLEESASWGKLRGRAKHVSLVGDITVCFPLMVVAALEMNSRRPREARNRS